MKRFLRNTFTGGILFLVPLVFLWMIISKANDIMLKVSEPLGKKLNDGFMGLDGSRLLSVLLLLVFCFVSGLLFRLSIAKKIMKMLEVNILSHIPGYTLFKSFAADVAGGDTSQQMTAVLVQEESTWKPGLLVETHGEWSTIYFPEVPKLDSGEVKMVLTSTVKLLDISGFQLMKYMKAFGKGMGKWVE